MEKAFNPQAIEKKWYQFWEKNGYFSPNGHGIPYSIMIPPPNVTGSLHMGHAFQDAIMDALVRYHRMKGKRTLWQVGTDHAGIATQMVVEKKIQREENKTRFEYERDEFIEKIWQWKNHSGSNITDQLRRLGASVDWENERFTMDEGFNKAVQKVFIHLYDEGLLYRGKRLVNWDPKLHTAISDLEVENKDTQGNMWYVRYLLADGIKTQDNKNYLVVATTRPETLLGDTGVAVNPNDERYRHLVGKEVFVPLINRRIPIVLDDYADMGKGTGCVKITPAHDFNDYEVGKRCQLNMINIFTADARLRKQFECFDYDGREHKQLSTDIPSDYQNLDRFVARKKIVIDLDAAGLLESIEDHALVVPYGDRSGVVVEPMLTDQWFVCMKPLAEPAIRAVQDGRVKFVSSQYENMFFSWMQEVQDWCISRQLWWGHRIPAWYDEQGKVYVGESEEAVRLKHQLSESIKLTQDEDVLDTWFSSSLWTFATLGWPENTERLKAFHPTDVLVTGFDIIFFWVARMLMMTLHFVKDEQGQPQIPFKHIYVTGLIRDENGQKMSKSKGNVLDPIDMIDGIDLQSLVKKRCSHMMQPQLAEKIEKQTRKNFSNGMVASGTDALRYTLYSLASTGRDINWDMNRLEGYRNFCNKIWNAASYVKMHTSKPLNRNILDGQVTLADRWIISKLQHLIVQVEKNYQDFRLDHASQNLYDFVWNEYCAWYVELSKPILWEENASSAQEGTRQTLIYVFEVLMRLLHPMMPFLTEEIWQNLKSLINIEGNTIMLMPYPSVNHDKIDSSAETDMEWVKGCIVCLRSIRSELNVSPSKVIDILVRNPSNDDLKKLTEYEYYIKPLAKINHIDILDESTVVPVSKTALVGSMELLVPMEGLIDRAAEIAKLNKEISKLNQEIQRIENKLNNTKFIQNAPALVIKKEKKKLDVSLDAVKKLQDQIIVFEKI